MHIYPDHWEIPASDMPWVRTHLVEDRAKMAHAVGKPIVLEESGFESFNESIAYLGYGASPELWLEERYGFANDAGYAGAMIWQLLPTISGIPGGYNYGFDTDVARVAFDQAARMAAVNDDFEYTPECRGSTDSDPDRDGIGEENGRACVFQYCSQPDSDDDYDSWGRENGRVCRVPL